MQVDPHTYRVQQTGSFGSRALIVGIIGLVVAVAGWLVNPERFFFSYLTAFTFVVTIALGALFFTMLHHLVGARWSVVVRRISEALMAPLPYLFIFFLPVIFGLSDLYSWTDADYVAHNHVLQWKEPFLNQTFFIIRAVIYFAIWSWLAYRLFKLSLAQDEGHVPEITMKLRKTSAYGMLLFAVTITLAGFDWLMSLDPVWYSTIFGVYVYGGAFLTFVCVLTLASLFLRRAKILADEITVEHYHDLGKLIFGFIIFWTYIGFSQYMLIWYANIPEETVWYLDRWEGSWQAVSLLIVFGYFAIPFIVMTFRAAKRVLPVLGVVAAWLVIMHWIDMYWLIFPNYEGAVHGADFHWMDLGTVIGIGGIYLWLFYRRLTVGAVLPVNDPKLTGSIQHINA